MKKFFEIKSFEGAQTIEVEYWENEFATTDNTGITLYDKYKISIMLSGGMLVVYKDKATRTERGDILVFRPDEIHSARIVDSGIYKFLNIFVSLNFFNHFLFDSSVVTEFLEQEKSENCIRPNREKGEKLLKKSEDLIRVMTEQGSDNIEAFTKLMSLLVAISRAYHDRNNLILKSDVPPVVEKALNFISKNYGSKLSLKEIAENSYCSVTYLSALFKENMGCTVYEYVTNYRILCAKQLLKEGKSVSDTCFECGFGDSSHFIKVFKEINGKTPYQYKKDLDTP